MSGGGNTTLTKALAFTGVPVMMRLPLITAEKKTAEWWSMLFEATMKSAGEEHRTLAISQNRHHQGVPSIAIILDGGWCKRKYKHTYNAISGMGTIIGKKTLFFGIWNKFCSTCSLADNLDQDPAKHTCLRNEILHRN